MAVFRILALLTASLLWVLPAKAEDFGEILLGAPTSLETLEGSESLKAVQMAIEEINENGGVSIGGIPHKLKLVSCDLDEVGSNTPPVHSVTRLARFIRDKRPHALVIGPFRSEVLLASMDLLAEEKMPILESIAMSPAVDAKILTDSKYRYIFRVGLSTKYLVSYLIETLKLLNRQFGFEKVFLLNQDVAWARSTAYLMLRLYLTRSQWQVLGQENCSAGTTDFLEILKRADRNGAQVILAIFDMPESKNLVLQWRAFKTSALLCGFISPATGPNAWTHFGGGLDGVINVIFELGNLPASRYPPAQIFYDAYEKRYGRPIQAGHGPAPSYESVYILADAFERAGSLDPDRVAEALAETDRKGVMGRMRFHRGHQAIFGQNPDQDVLACVAQWKSPGKRIIVYPNAIAEGQITLPALTPSVPKTRLQ